MKILLGLATLIVPLSAALSQEPSLRDQAASSLQRGAEFFRKHVAVEGTYLWQYSEDLSKREGEGEATPTQGWVQPPGTPAVGLAFLAAWHSTSNQLFLEAARETAYGLIRGQLLSGGWTYLIDFSREGRTKAAYRDQGKKTARNVTTFDDDTTQAALRFLMRMDRATGFKDPKIQESIEYALNSILQAQYPNGSWPQGYDQFPEPDKFPVRKASYPEEWFRTWPGSQQYWLRYTLNDNSMATTIDTLSEAGRIYQEAAKDSPFHALAAKCRAAVDKAGEFILLAQMPEPQPAWAQQYDFDMHPSWARKFEPPSVSGGESQGVLKTLLKLYRETGDRKYLDPIPRALAYLRRSRLPDGRLARFYELQSNKPLYFTRTYLLTHDDGDMPTHYSFKVTDDTEAIARDYERVKQLPVTELKPKPPGPGRVTENLISQVKSVIAAQDNRGRWVEPGKLRHQKTADPGTSIIRCATFIRNVELLCRYLDASAAQ